MARFTQITSGLAGPQGPIGPQGPAGENAVASPETIYQVAGGTVNFNSTTAIQPTFNGAPLFTSSYVKMGSVVFFRINVAMTNITNFGAGQYFMTVPFDSKYDIFLRSGHLHDSSSDKNYAIAGEILANSNVLKLSYTASNGQDGAFTSTSPVTLAMADDFHIAGSYICKE